MDTYRHRGQRRQLINELRDAGRYDERVLKVMAQIPRHAFLQSAFQEWAYRDEAFPIDCDQTISQPSTVAWQTSALKVLSRQHVLEIGTGSGYQAAVLSVLGARVFTVERHKPLFRRAKLTLKKLRLDGVRCFYRDGNNGLPEFAPYDRILATAGAPSVPKNLLEQLKVGGVLVIPIGAEDAPQEMVRITRTGRDEYQREDLGTCEFVPFREGLN